MLDCYKKGLFTSGFHKYKHNSMFWYVIALFASNNNIIYGYNIYPILLTNLYSILLCNLIQVYDEQDKYLVMINLTCKLLEG